MRSGAQNKLRTLDGVDSQNSNTKSLNAQQNLCARVTDDCFLFVCLFFFLQGSFAITLSLA